MLIELSNPRHRPGKAHARSQGFTAVAPLVSSVEAVDFSRVLKVSATAEPIAAQVPEPTPSAPAAAVSATAADKSDAPLVPQVSFLAELEQQVRSQPVPEGPDREALVRNARMANTACRAVLDYWTRLVEHLNALKMTSPCRYVFDGRTALERRPSLGFRVVPKLRTSHRGDEHFESITLSWRVGSGERVTLTKEFPVEIDRLRARLAFAGISAFETQCRDPQSGRLRGTQFEFTADVNASVRITPLHDEGKVRLTLLNLTSLERTEAELPAFAMREHELDELARMVCGRPSGLLKHAQKLVRHEP